MIRKRFPARRTVPSTSPPTFSAWPICCAGTAFPLNAYDDVREATRSRGTRESASASSSVIPSEKYSSCGFPLVFANGSTARVLIEGAVPALAPERPNTFAICPRNAIAPIRRSAAMPMSAPLRRLVVAVIDAESSSVFTNSCADCGRSAGCFSIARMMRAARGAGTLPRTSSIGRGFSEI